MTKRIYVCNVCRDEFGIPGTIKAIDQIIGFEWSGGGVAEKHPTSCENHICVFCLENMHKLHQQVRQRQVGQTVK